MLWKSMEGKEISTSYVNAIKKTIKWNKVRKSMIQNVRKISSPNIRAHSHSTNLFLLFEIWQLVWQEKLSNHKPLNPIPKTWNLQSSYPISIQFLLHFRWLRYDFDQMGLRDTVVWISRFFNTKVFLWNLRPNCDSTNSFSCSKSGKRFCKKDFQKLIPQTVRSETPLPATLKLQTLRRQTRNH